MLKCFLDFVGIQRLLIAFTLVLELVGEQRLLGAHGGKPDLVVVIVSVLPETVEAVLLIAGLGCAHAPDDARRHHQRRHGGRCKAEEKCYVYNVTLNIKTWMSWTI